MRDKHIKIAGNDQTHRSVPVKAGSDETAVKVQLHPANSNQDLNLVKITSSWKRRDQSAPKWWRDHLRAMFR